MKIWQRISETMDSIKGEFDKRSMKPFIQLWDWAEHGHTRIPENWLLECNHSEMLIIKPNDIAIYSSISEKMLAEAQVFFNDNIKSRKGNPLPQFIDRKSSTNEYYDYFEKIIVAIIMSYTSIETFANICIPKEYQYYDEKKDITYGAKNIEKHFHIREKLKICLPEILGTPQITSELWWNKLVELENIRNEIIHSKPSKSEVRYSHFISDRIFEIIPVNKDVFNYFGSYIKANKPELLDVFPFGFGFDEFSEKYISKSELNQMMNALNRTDNQKYV